MATRTETVTIHTCDGCGKEVFLVNDEPVPGISGEAFEITGAGGWGGRWWACSRKCVKAAVLTALDRSY